MLAFHFGVTCGAVGILNINNRMLTAQLWCEKGGRSPWKDTSWPDRIPSPPPSCLIVSLFTFMSLRFLKNVFALLSRRQSNILCVSRTYCIASWCCVNHPHVKKGVHINYKRKYLRMFCSLLMAPASWCLPYLCLQLVNRNGKHFVLSVQQWGQTSWMSLFLIRAQLLVISRVFPFLPLHPFHLPFPPLHCPPPPMASGFSF